MVVIKKWVVQGELSYEDEGHFYIWHGDNVEIRYNKRFCEYGGESC